MSLMKLIDAATFYHVLERIDAELAETTRRALQRRPKSDPLRGGILIHAAA
jgi:hypothetical protein